MELNTNILIVIMKLRQKRSGITVLPEESGGQLRLMIGVARFIPNIPPVILEGYLAEVDWRLKEDFRGIARNAPENHRRLTEPELRHLIPYGSTVLRMTEMPMLED